MIKIRILFLVLLFCWTLTGCGSTPATRFYTLDSLAKAETITPEQAPNRRLIVGIGPIALPKYLEHPALTTRSSVTTLNRSELDRWGGSLGDEVSRVLVENLGGLLPAGRYLPLPWLETPVSDYRAQISITRFDGPPEGPVQLHAGWLLLSGTDTLLVSGDVAIAEPQQGTGPEATAAAMSRALVELSRWIAAAIQTTAGATETIDPAVEKNKAL